MCIPASNERERDVRKGKARNEESNGSEVETNHHANRGVCGECSES